MGEFLGILSSGRPIWITAKKVAGYFSGNKKARSLVGEQAFLGEKIAGD
jgi:hypothetical protein